MEKTTRKRGRPPKAPEDVRSEVLFIKLLPNEKRELEAAFDEPSVWVRRYALTAARRVNRKKIASATRQAD